MLLLGATGTIGRATARELLARGHEVLCVLRPGSRAGLPPGALRREAELRDPAAVARDALAGQRIDALVSCLASRSGEPADAWAIDHLAQRHALRAAIDAGATQAVLLSAICVQKPRLAFQHAKLAFEAELRASGVGWTIVRPTAYFKSLSGQIERVRVGRPFLVFGDGRLTACKPIADADLAAYLADCLDDPARQGRVLPIGGPGAAITPREQAERLCALLGRPLRLRAVPPGLLAGIAGGLGAVARAWPPLRAKAELARIGHYYATESMLVWDAAAGRYDADATPSFGRRTLWDHYAARVAGEPPDERGEHAVF
ncbi:NAD(P)H-binding protein [Piscinibacter sakaiensis]|uniref:Divinyl chlorophyllide a 8-vinyl-reductase, chloroplastic n=1 Tax=Piscinibacter sakaiensis TaxID=1547922 RepID=A0A0K8P1N5_PISS1|nr:NAD(P)H-binding protein [Piscinibacter sakaiensis]GAP36533.1 divinyl protochlorophyllide a 8-vinyl-reductase [Piscinibacter sakaiensis]